LCEQVGKLNSATYYLLTYIIQFLPFYRTVGNYLEQTPAFLLAIWMCAIFVDVETAILYGWLWILFRAIYPIVFYIGGLFLFVSTIPAYFCVWYMLWRVVAVAAAT